MPTFGYSPSPYSAEAANSVITRYSFALMPFGVRLLPSTGWSRKFSP